MEWIDDDGFEINGGFYQTNNGDIAPKFNTTYYNNNVISQGALVSGYNNTIHSGDGIIVIGNNNFISPNTKNISILSSSGITVYENSSNINITTCTGVTVLSGNTNIAVTNSSGITVTESNVTYNNGIKTLNNISYKKYVALLTQTGVTAPTINVLETTMSSGITSSYINVGEYKLISNAEFTANKTFVMINQTGLSMIGVQAIILANRIGNNEIAVQVADTLGSGYLDDVLLDTQIEIRVYS